MTDISILSPSVLRQRLRYDPETGKLFWKKALPEHFQESPERSGEYRAKIFNARFHGKEALVGMVDGYSVGRISGIAVKDHRVIWAMIHDEWPSGEIDHINGDRSDNRISNLRCVSRVENQRNSKRRSDNTSGVTGVRRSPSCSTWCVFIGDRYIGSYRTKKEAARIRALEAAKLGFSVRHGT